RRKTVLKYRCRLKRKSGSDGISDIWRVGTFVSDGISDYLKKGKHEHQAMAGRRKAQGKAVGTRGGGFE
ncbi:hypothetical protein MM710_38835, partial [Klebsiella pneumoniae]|nr:hypothetical protein [Klebsiella pneumoniae]